MTELAEVHDELRTVARELLGKAAEWRTLAEAGWLGLEVPEALDGAGASFAEVGVVLEELGRAAARTPYLSAVVLGVGALNLLLPSAARDELLRDIAAGDMKPALVEGAFRIERGRLHGEAAFVPDVVEADRLLVLAVEAGGVPVIVEPDAGIVRTAQPVVDATRGFGSVTADGVGIREVWRFAEPSSAVQSLRDRAAVAVACDSLGVSAAMLDATVRYVQVREQFGRPIGSFQAVQHACADLLVRVTVARELVEAAVRNPGGEAAWMAKAYAGECAVAVAGKAMQLHGGIGYTWESGVHVYLKRAALNRALYGSPTEHRRLLARRYAMSTALNSC